MESQSTSSNSSSKTIVVSIQTKLKVDVKNLLKVAQSKPIDYSEVKTQLRTFRRHFEKANDQEYGTHERRKTSGILRESGVFGVLVRLLEETLTAHKAKVLNRDLDVEFFSNALNILANFFVFADGPETSNGSKEWELHLLDLTRSILQHSILSSNGEILHRALRLTTNLLKRHNTSVLRVGLLDAILGSMSKAKTLEGTDAPTTIQKVLMAIFRCLRICVSDRNVKLRINSMQGIWIVTEPLFWKHHSLDDPCQLQIFQTLNLLLDDKMSGMSREQVERLSQDNRLLRTVIKRFRNSVPNSEIHSISECILRNLILSKTLMTAVVDAGIYEAILYHISASEVNLILDSKLELLSQLLLAGSAVYVPTIVGAKNLNSLIGSLLKVLRINELCRHRVMIWWLYQSLVPDSLTSLIGSGLMTEVRHSLHESCGVTSFDQLRKNLDVAFLAAASQSTAYTPPHSICLPPKRIQRPEAYAAESPVGSPQSSPAQSSPTSSGFYSINDDSDEGPYSPLASEEDTESLDNVESQTEYFISNQDEVSSDDGLPRKRMKLNSPPEREPTGSDTSEVSPIQSKSSKLNTLYEVSLVGNMLNLVKKLVFIPSARQELATLLPTFMGLFQEVGSLPWMEFLPQIGNFRSTFIVPCDKGQILTSLGVILSNLFLDQNLFQQFVSAEVQSVLHKMDFTGHEEMSPSVRKLLAALRGNTYSFIRQITLTQHLTSIKDPMLKIKSAIALPILFNEVTPHNWFTKCAEVLIDSMDEVKTSPSMLLDPDNLVLSLFALTDHFDLNWSQLQLQMRATQLPLISESEFRLPNSPTDTTVAIETSGSVLHIETEFLHEASPVFQVMLESNFREAKERKINLTETSGDAIRLFFEQILHSLKRSQSNPVEQEVPTCQKYSLQTLFDILTLSHTYMVAQLYNETVNRILATELGPTTFGTIYRATSPFPEFPSNVTESDSLSIRAMVLLYFLTTNQLSIPTKTLMLKELLDDTPSIVMDLRALYSKITLKYKKLR